MSDINKPGVFIGSSIEGLSVANAIQENLQYDAECTVWTQGTFDLSGTTITDLLDRAAHSDFAIFVFHPDDELMFRNNTKVAVRDNVLFEYGLFTGKLGLDKVFFVLPDQQENFHLPTDLSGITPGKYQPDRKDKNLVAALGPFCNRVRQKLITHEQEFLVDLISETEEVKQLILKKPECWEFLLSSSLLEKKMKVINEMYREITQGFLYTRPQKYSFQEFARWFSFSNDSLLKLMHTLKNIFSIELKEAYGPPGLPGNASAIKKSIEHIISVCKELLAWEQEVQSIVVDQPLDEIVNLIKGWSLPFLTQINDYPRQMRLQCENLIKSHCDGITVHLTFEPPPNVDQVTNILQAATRDVANGHLLIE